MLFALVLHFFRQPMSEELEVGGLASFFLKLGFELVNAFLGRVQCLFCCIALVDRFSVGFLGVSKSSAG